MNISKISQQYLELVNLVNSKEHISFRSEIISMECDEIWIINKYKQFKSIWLFDIQISSFYKLEPIKRVYTQFKIDDEMIRSRLQ